MSVEKEFAGATALHQAGRLTEARAAYERVLSQYPSHADALHYLGIIMCQIGRPDAGSDLIARAIAIDPDSALYQNNLGLALKSCGRIEEALTAFRRSVELNTSDPLTYSNLGDALRDAGRAEEATTACRRALELKPDYAEAWNNLGNALKGQGLIEETVTAYRRAAELRPDIAVIQNNLGNALLNAGDFPGATAACQRAVALNPSFAEAYINLGTALREQKMLVDAIGAYRRATQLQPDLTEGNLNLAGALTKQALVDEALTVLARVKQSDPAVAKAYMHLGYAFACQGLPDQALACYRQAIPINPDHALDHSFMVYSTGLHPSFTSRQIFEEAAAWEIRHAKPLAVEIEPLSHDRSPDRKLKIGYVSPDYRDHVLGWFMPPILENHNRGRFEIHCFSSAKKPDAWTARLRDMADHWHDVADLSDRELADLIRRQRIDILVDQAVHCLDNRLLVFARKPAPVQVSYLAYFGTTGLRTMDYLLCDPYMELTGKGADHCFSERLVRLPRTYWCYRPHPFSPEPGPLPASAKGHITFGCLNNSCKLNPSVWEVWIKILHRVPGSRMILHGGNGEEVVQARLRISQLLTQAGIDPHRVELIGRQTIPAYLATYQKIDIALDPFPYTGGATTCDALWMGVPIITLKGQTSVSRGGYSLLSNIGLGDLVADTHERYIKLAVELSSDVPRLTHLRFNLRQRMQRSPLMDEPAFVADLEAAYRAIWQRWCGTAVSDLERSAELLQDGLLDEACEAAKKAIELDPASVQGRMILANVYRAMALPDESIRLLREVVKLDPAAAAYHSNLVFTVMAHPAYSPSQQCHEAVEWARLHANPTLGTRRVFTNERSPDRRLRIGYVSPDFTGHPVGRFLAPIFSHHDRSNYEIHCFSNTVNPDEFTQIFRQAANGWHDLVGLDDAAAADLIHSCEIDILVDLALHTAYNRLPIFARRPAPVQVTYLAYCGTSGIKSIDYLLCDPYLIPGTDDGTAYCEEPVRLPRTYWCYRMFNGAPEMGPLPALSAGYVTFGCFNNFAKVTPQAIEVWGQLLVRVPGSRLVLHAAHGSHRTRILNQLQSAGVEPSRIGFVAKTKIGEYFANYKSIDIGLDTFPFNGGTTTCDALWMGVPVVSLAGTTAVSRGGLSLLSNIGLSELVARSLEEYVDVAERLAKDPQRLKDLHDNLRERMRSSPLMDGPQFTADLEAAYRMMWKRWCETRAESKS